VAAACGGSSGSSGSSGGTSEGRTGSPAPALAGTALDGSAVDLAALRGRPVIVNFWASWCMPCREEFPLFAARLAELGASDGLVIIGVLYKDEPALAQQFIDDAGAAWPSLPDPDGTLAAAYRVVAPPQTYFIDADGVLRGIQIGEVREVDFDTQYAKIRP
jgi:cytochrome c biogenesis protein CcmG/thiol:disulfide interchange protein DsbE